MDCRGIVARLTIAIIRHHAGAAQARPLSRFPLATPR
ncbi:hypothetical protein NX02_27725 [Sphingomonas sanxanigenens DSM 19645 = NX02]|uniref:Uncharacterized protein n=1 Tax=Sphingomonas sanxanigenens DSM 19645 = NX02 TaxID=1123269 RepID=W0ALE7_9SPHN|nr:hypothetical protein NX02_27725 [Sphingomonas sanxanigenens DSM 19645 = NX02]